MIRLYLIDTSYLTKNLTENGTFMMNKRLLCRFELFRKAVIYGQKASVDELTYLLTKYHLNDISKKSKEYGCFLVNLSVY